MNIKWSRSWAMYGSKTCSVSWLFPLLNCSASPRSCSRSAFPKRRWFENQVKEAKLFERFSANSLQIPCKDKTFRNRHFPNQWISQQKWNFRFKKIIDWYVISHTKCSALRIDFANNDSSEINTPRCDWSVQCRRVSLSVWLVLV